MGVLGFSGFRGFGVLGFWGFGVLGFWGFGVLGFWGFGVFGVLGFSGFWDFGGSGCFGFWGVLGSTREFADRVDMTPPDQECMQTPSLETTRTGASGASGPPTAQDPSYFSQVTLSPTGLSRTMLRVATSKAFQNSRSVN